MTKRKNEFGIKCLIMCPAFNIVDPVTQANLQMKSVIEFFPDDFLPDFIETQNTIRQIIEKKKLTVDAAANALIDIFNEYAPRGIKVKIDVINNNTFFPVSVTTEDGEVDEIFEKKKSVKKPAKKKEIETDENEDDEDIEDDE